MQIQKHDDKIGQLIWKNSSCKYLHAVSIRKKKTYNEIQPSGNNLKFDESSKGLLK